MYKGCPLVGRSIRGFTVFLHTFCYMQVNRTSTLLGVLSPDKCLFEGKYNLKQPSVIYENDTKMPLFCSTLLSSPLICSTPHTPN